MVEQPLVMLPGPGFQYPVREPRRRVGPQRYVALRWQPGSPDQVGADGREPRLRVELRLERHRCVDPPFGAGLRVPGPIPSGGELGDVPERGPFACHYALRVTYVSDLVY